MPDSVRALREDVSELKAGTLQLADQVHILSGALSTMNSLALEQQRITEKVDSVEQDSASKDDLSVERGHRQRESKKAKTWLIVVASFGLVQLLVGALLTLFFQQSRSNFQQYRSNAYNVCQARSDQATKVRAYLENAAKPALAQARSKAERDLIAKQIQQLEAAFPTVDCSGLK